MPSARITKDEGERVAKIRVELAQEGIYPELWEFDMLACGAKFFTVKKSTFQ